MSHHQSAAAVPRFRGIGFRVVETFILKVIKAQTSVSTVSLNFQRIVAAGCVVGSLQNAPKLQVLCCWGQ